MTRHDPPPPAALPICIIEVVLANIPLFSDRHVPIYSLLNVLPQATVPAAYASLIANVLPFETPRDEHLQRALKRLVADTAAAARIKQLLTHLRQKLENEFVITPLLGAMAHFGNIDLLEYVATIPGVSLSDWSCVVVGEACKAGHVHVLNWWIDNRLSLDGLSLEAIEAAAKAGHLAILKWWYSWNPSVDIDVDNSSIVLDMVAMGRIECLRWWIDHINVPDDFEFKLEHWTAASKGGHLSMLQFAKSCEHELPSDTAACIDGAAANGHVHVLTWWYQNIGHDCVLSYTVDAMDLASAGGHVAVLDWFSQSGLELRFTPAALRTAREKGYHAVVKWWRNCPLHASMAAGHQVPRNVFQRTNQDFVTMCAFAMSDLLDRDMIAEQTTETLERALAVACREGHSSMQDVISRFGHLPNHPSNLDLKHAVEYNRPAVLQWCFRFQPYIWPDSNWWLPSIKVALKSGYIDVLELLLAANSLFWDQHAAEYVESACDGGCIHSLKFLNDALATVASWPVAVCEAAVTAAARAGHAAVLVWLEDNGLDFEDEEYDWTQIADIASANGHLVVLRWWVGYNLPLHFTEQALRDAVKNKHHKMIQWWIDSGLVFGERMREMLQDALDAIE